MSDVIVNPARDNFTCSQSKQRVRDELHAIRIGLSVLMEEMQDGLHDEAERTYQTINASLNRLANDEIFQD